MNLSFSPDSNPESKLFFVGALAGLAKAGMKAGMKASVKKPTVARPRPLPKPTIPKLQISTGDININSDKKENEQQ
ncbi:MAG: hypothetical protein EBU66_19280 [Bacteroidetes bacterium]|nr:hypothetical protein [bacterium]NBP66777.1 hypothetical protein [Bacteroidota bacterium]